MELSRDRMIVRCPENFLAQLIDALDNRYLSLSGRNFLLHRSKLWSLHNDVKAAIYLC